MTLIWCGFVGTDRFDELYHSLFFSNLWHLLSFHNAIKDDLSDANDPDSFGRLVMLMGGRKAANPLDYIYGLLGMVDKGIRSKIAIDYSDEHRSNYVSLWIKAAKLAFLDARPAKSFGEMFDWFGGAQSDNDGNVASWCPNLRGTHVESFETYIAEKKAGQPPKDRYPELPGQVTCSWEHDRISVDAFMVDLIGKVHIPTLPSPAVPRGHDDFLTMSQALLEWMVSAYLPHGEVGSLPPAYIRSFLAINNADSEDRQFWTPEALQHVFSRFVYFLATTIKNLWANNEWGLEQVLEALGDEELAKLTMLDLQRVLSVYHRRAFIVTRSGRYGIAPDNVRKGDNLCIVPGAKYVYVLSADTRRLLGHAYIDGLMSGEVFEMYDRGEIKFETLGVH